MEEKKYEKLSPILGFARTATIKASSEVDSNIKRDKGIGYINIYFLAADLKLVL